MILPLFLQRHRQTWLLDRFTRKLDPMQSLLFDGPDTALIVIDRAGRIVRANSKAHHLFLDNAAVAVGFPVDTLFAVDDAEKIGDHIASATLGKTSSVPLRTRVRSCINEGETPVHVWVQPLLEADKAVSGLLLRLADLSEEQHLQAELAAGQKLQALGQLSAGIAHDFNNLLTAVIGAADSVLDRPGLMPEVRSDVRQIRRVGERGAALVKQMLAFSRQQPLQPRVIHLNEAIRELSHLLPRMLGPTVAVNLSLDESDRCVLADPAQFDQVLVNLALNARDAMPSGGSLTIHTDHRNFYKPILDGTETIPPGRYIVIEVSDTGCGIPPDVLPHIFEPFFTTRREVGGSDLGLSTVHGIIRQSNGLVTTETAEEQGTTIRIYLPRHEGEPVPKIAPAARQIPNTSSTQTLRPNDLGPLLLVEDEDTLRDLAERALRTDGWSVLAARSAKDAWHLLVSPGAPPPCILVSDILMPGQDGISLLQSLRQRWPELPAVLVSGYAESATRSDLSRHGTAFLAKPYELKELRRVVKQVASLVVHE